MSSNPLFYQPEPEFYDATVSRDTSAAEKSLQEAIESYPSGIYIPERGNVSYNPATDEFAFTNQILGKLNDDEILKILQKSLAQGPSGISPPPGFQSVDEAPYVSMLIKRKQNTEISFIEKSDSPILPVASIISGAIVFVFVGFILARKFSGR